MLKVFSGLFLLLLWQSVAAMDLSGQKKIFLVSADNKTLEIGEIVFTNESDETRYKIQFSKTVFSDHFLSMRPFQCIELGEQMLCRLAYPYDKGMTVTANNLKNLEYDLLFIHKSADEYGIDPWNGRYYKLSMTESGLKGVLNEVDLNVLSSPPREGVSYPITDGMLHEVSPDVHLYPKLLIE